jgi:tRNA U34 2-thiouridine synthase MnmA/TrmU
VQDTPDSGKVYTARARYRAPLAEITVTKDGVVEVVQGELVPASGQSLVVYDGTVCIGGGIIQ